MSESHFWSGDSSRRYPNYVFIDRNQALGCGQAFVGMHGGYQLLTLSPDSRCLTVGTIMHEMLHTLGVEHEQSRPDRNKYIDVHNPNVQNGKPLSWSVGETKFILKKFIEKESMN